MANVVSYDQSGLALQHTVTYVADSIVTGKIYSFTFRATNSKGNSDYSEILSIAVIDPPL